MSKVDEILSVLIPLFDQTLTAAGTIAPMTSAECRQLMIDREQGASSPADLAQIQEDNECLAMRAMFLEKQGL